MNNRDRAASVADLARMFASKSVAKGETEETIAADMIGNLLHWVMRETEMAGGDGRKAALAAIRCGLSQFMSEVHEAGNQPGSANCYTLITARVNGGLWVSETGYEESIQ